MKFFACGVKITLLIDKRNTLYFFFTNKEIPYMYLWLTFICVG